MIHATLTYVKEGLEHLLYIVYYTDGIPDELVDEAEKALVSIDRVIEWMNQLEVEE